MSTNMIEIKRVIFHDMPDFVLSIGQWESIGGWKGFLKYNGVSISQVKKVETSKMPERTFFKLKPWGGVRLTLKKVGSLGIARLLIISQILILK